MAMVLMLMFESSSEYPLFLIAVTPGEHPPDDHTYKTPWLSLISNLDDNPPFRFFVLCLTTS